MIQPNLNSLNIPLSDSIKASDSSLCWREFLLSVSYFTNQCSYKIFEEEIADITKSLFNWTHRKDFLNYRIKDTASVSPRMIQGDVKLGDIFLVDLGLNYKPELSYAHPALILEEIDSMVAIVPTSTNCDKIRDAYHPISNSIGKWFYRKVDRSNGFDEECVLLLNNLRVISKGRLIDKKGSLNENITLSNSIFSEVKQRIFENYLPKQYINYLKLIEENDKLNNEILSLKDEIEKLKEK